MRNYVNFRGRARRREFWMFTLFNTLVYLLLLAVGLVLLGAVIYKSVAEGGDAAEHATAYTLAVAGLLLLVYGWMLATFLPGLAVRVRRLHDIGRSGWWLAGYYGVAFVCTILMMIGSVLMLGGKGSGMALTGVGFAVLMITAVWMIVWMCFDSQAGENKYGPNPKQIAAPVESAAPAAAAEPSEPETPKAE